VSSPHRAVQPRAALLSCTLRTTQLILVVALLACCGKDAKDRVASAAGGDSAVDGGSDTPMQDGRTENPVPPAVRWTGNVSADDASAPIEFVISENDGGELTGYQVFFDPQNSSAIKAGAISGNRIGNRVSWTGEGGVTVAGTLDGTNFAGTITFEGAFEVEPLTARLELILGDEP
jgi:hypothetical protein